MNNLGYYIMSYGARVRILGAAWNVVKIQGKKHSPLVVSKDSKGGGEGETVSGRRTEGKGKVEKGAFFFIPPKNPGPNFYYYIPKKRGNPFLDSS